VVKSKKYHKEYSRKWREIDQELSKKYQAIGFDNTETFTNFKKRHKKK